MVSGRYGECGKHFLIKTRCHPNAWHDSGYNKVSTDTAWINIKCISLHNSVQAHSCHSVTVGKMIFKAAQWRNSEHTLLRAHTGWLLFICDSITDIICWNEKCHGNAKGGFRVCYSLDILSVWTTHWSFWQFVGTFLESRDELSSSS